ncbi:DeoR/GlpR family transcriptional regulator of sugar metabolism [Roseospira visakhapatnamensis]|uniref:DeoR/GlpR family transcriptional regulator of sugar metabolism n=2 Tax=Roseospira visakhapatnamensis TaxID=390880 RepID=A0A7W6RCW8_9PROT|nr:DeoR/GlpR family transcriptional regulator of sugar metabolism [Roseospira visakhapatnamensis]
MEILGTRSALRVADLAAELDVSTETVRRDLDDLTRQGLIDRTYGGAVRRPSLEPGLSERQTQLVPQRQAIARAAVPLLAGARHVMIGSGSTTMHVSRRLAFEMRDVTVLTHSFGAATVLAGNPAITVMMTPGVYHLGEGALHGGQTLRFLEDFRADWAVVGASGLMPDGASDAMIEAAEVYGAMARRSARVMVVADSSKFDRAFPASYASWEGIDVLVTDTPPRGPLARAIAAAKVSVRVECSAAPPPGTETSGGRAS